MSPRLRFQILTRDNFTCRYCGRKAPEVDLHVDHVFPVSAGGTDTEDNLVTACVDCNRGKRDRLVPTDSDPLAQRIKQLRWKGREMEVQSQAWNLIVLLRRRGFEAVVWEFDGISLSVSATDSSRDVLARWRIAYRKAQASA